MTEVVSILTTLFGSSVVFQLVMQLCIQFEQLQLPLSITSLIALGLASFMWRMWCDKTWRSPRDIYPISLYVSLWVGIILGGWSAL